MRAGIGRLTIADRDYIDESNLQRQSLYTEADCRACLPKATAAAAHLVLINSRVELIPEIVDVNAATFGEISAAQSCRGSRSSDRGGQCGASQRHSASLRLRRASGPEGRTLVGSLSV